MRSKGFSLVEVAVVLVVAGLLMGAFLQGKEMVLQGRAKGVIADFSGVMIAHQTYLDRYHAQPGDDRDADTRWTGANAGNGNGVVSGRYNADSASSESRLWWDHLRRAGFVTGSGPRQPLNVFGGVLGVQFGAANGERWGGFGLMLCTANVPDRIAIAVDTILDDGAGSSGEVRAVLQANPNPVIDENTVPATYAENGANVYTLCRELR